MTDDEAKVLYARAVAAGFRLEPGCRVWSDGDIDTVVWVGRMANPRLWGEYVGTHLWVPMPTADVWCDFREAPSLGCLLGQVRKAINPGVHATRWSNGSWSAMDPDNDENEEITLAFSSEAEALVAALDAAQ
jgi:hypothetical protein